MNVFEDEIVVLEALNIMRNMPVDVMGFPVVF